MDQIEGNGASNLTPNLTHIMVDIETTGTDPAHSAIIQIAAVGFNIHTKEIDLDFFDRCLDIPANRFWDESTRDWWIDGQPHVLNQIMARAELHERVMRDFVTWVGRKGVTTMAAKPSSFESPFIESYCRMVGLPNPFKYWKTLDVNSYIEGRGHDRSMFWKNIEFEGDAHNAIFDVLHQIKGLFHA